MRLSILISHRMLALVALALGCIGLQAQEVSVSLHVTTSAPVQSRAHAGMKMKTAWQTPVVGWLTPLNAIEGNAHAVQPAHTYTLLQKDKQFTPHLLVVPTGSKVEFPNLDPFFHNVFSLFNGRRFDLGLYEAGSRRTVRFDHDGVSYIFCNIHPEMGAVIVSLSSPWYAIANKDGILTIDHVPAGDYELTLWAENVAASDLASAKQRIHVGAEDVHLGSFALKSTAAAEQHLNKFGEEYKKSEQPAY